MKIPTMLKHKPVICAEDYAKIDGKYAGKTDAQGLSLGLAQWNDRGNVDVSAKIWRHSGEKWSRQSEEMPLHRVLDLAIMIVKSYGYFKEAYRIPGLFKPEDPIIGNIALQGAKTPLSVCVDNSMIDTDIQLFAQSLSDEGERLGERFQVLIDALKEAGC